MLIVLGSAALHAAWNALVRTSHDKFYDTVLLVAGAAVWTVFLLPQWPLPAAQSWPYLAASAVIHVAYFSIVALSYRSGELSFTYPLMRGAAPLMSAMGALLLVHESLTLGGWGGVLLISAGVLVMTGDAWRAGTFRVAPAAYALGNAVIIALYTLIDGQGARLSGHAFSYTGWLFYLTALLLVAVAAVRNAPVLAKRAQSTWRQALMGGACTLAAYGLVLWAMTQAPIALVAALRETSVVFAGLIAAVFLKERITPLRYLSIIMVCAGAVTMKLF